MSFDSAPIPPYNASDPHARFLSSSALDLLLIELVPLSYRLAAEFSTLSPPPPPLPHSKDLSTTTSSTTTTSQTATKDNSSSSTAGPTATTTVPEDPTEEETREAVFYRLEGLGYRVGLGLVERFSRERPRFEDPLDVIKFLCKDLWMIVWRKQVDNLKTNHRVGYFAVSWPCFDFWGGFWANGVYRCL